MTARARWAAAGIGVLADELLGEPPDGVHPVARFGQAMAWREARRWADRRGAGVAHALVGVTTGVVAGATLRRTVGPTAATAVATEVAVAGRMLRRLATEVGLALEAGDLARARALLPGLVGRAPDRLDAAGIARAVIESVAENTVDAVVAPAWWAAVAGAPGVLGHRAVNTLDAMVGHHSARYEHFGWASARLDDVAAWVPARLTAAAVVVARPRAAAAVSTAVRTQAPAHPSPNSGVAEAAFAAALGVRLVGVVDYGDHVEDRGVLGAGRVPEPQDIAAAVALSRHVGWVVSGALVAPAVVTGAIRSARYGARRRRGEHRP